MGYLFYSDTVGIRWCLLRISQWVVVLGESSNKTKCAKVTVLLLAVAAREHITRGELCLFTCEEQLWGGCRRKERPTNAPTVLVQTPSRCEFSGLPLSHPGLLLHQS